LVDLSTRLPAVQAMLQSSLRGDIAVDIEVQPDIWPILIDLSEFELALLNLAVNARDAMPAGGRLVLAARNVSLLPSNEAGLAGDFVAVSVTDTGTGIDPAIASKVFEPFFTTKEVNKGTGLGLSQVYGFAQQAGGTALIDSIQGEGTTVTVYLPRSESGGEVIEASQPEPRAVAGAKGLRVLLVEDNAQVAEVTRALLEERGYWVISCSNADSAIETLKAGHRVDIVLTDIIMPGKTDGLDLARHLRVTRPDLPVILASGYSDKAQAAANEGYRLLRKPFDGTLLDEALAEVLHERTPEP
jgi:two-component system NtrC family sensor kinase